MKNPLFQCDSSKWPLIASLLGCDYIDRMHNVGHSTLFNKTLPKLVSWTAQETMDVINNALKQKMTPDHKIELCKSINLFKFAPVLNNNNKLTPLWDDVDENIWGEEIGFMKHPTEFDAFIGRFAWQSQML